MGVPVDHSLSSQLRPQQTAQMLNHIIPSLRSGEAIAMTPESKWFEIAQQLPRCGNHSQFLITHFHLKVIYYLVKTLVAE